MTAKFARLRVAGSWLSKSRIRDNIQTLRSQGTAQALHVAPSIMLRWLIELQVDPSHTGLDRHLVSITSDRCPRNLKYFGSYTGGAFNHFGFTSQPPSIFELGK